MCFGSLARSKGSERSVHTVDTDAFDLQRSCSSQKSVKVRGQRAVPAKERRSLPSLTGAPEAWVRFASQAAPLGGLRGTGFSTRPHGFDSHHLQLPIW